MASSCIFCNIIAGEIPSKKAYSDEFVYAFHDIDPKAPTHILVVPREHYAGIHEIPAAKMDLIQKLFAAVNAIVIRENLATAGYRLVVNFGKQGGQAVPHIHVHILAGRALSWPPG